MLNIFFFFQAEDGIRDKLVTGVQTCALPILRLTSSWFISSSRISGGAACAVTLTNRSAISHRDMGREITTQKRRTNSIRPPKTWVFELPQESGLRGRERTQAATMESFPFCPL